jgi:hypothetical protein
MLTENQRQMYADCETAARSEHRGIWKDSKPLPPWEFKETQQPPNLPKESPTVQTAPAVQTRKNPGLTRERTSKVV